MNNFCLPSFCMSVIPRSSVIEYTLGTTMQFTQNSFILIQVWIYDHKHSIHGNRDLYHNKICTTMNTCTYSTVYNSTSTDRNSVSLVHTWECKEYLTPEGWSRSLCGHSGSVPAILISFSRRILTPQERTRLWCGRSGWIKVSRC